MVSAVELFLGTVLQKYRHRLGHSASSCFHGEVQRNVALLVLHKDICTARSQVPHVVSVEDRRSVMQQCSMAPTAVNIDERVDVPAKMF